MMYLAGFDYAARTFRDYPTLVKIDIKVAREQLTISMGHADNWSEGRIDGFLSAFGY